MGYPRSDPDEDSGKESESIEQFAEACDDLLAIFVVKLTSKQMGGVREINTKRQKACT